MKTVVERNGVKAEFLEAGVLLTFVSGDQKLFARNGDLIWEQENEPESFKHFFSMGREERLKVSYWRNDVSAETLEEKAFLDHVEKALAVIDYDYQIATLDPCVSEEGKIYYEEGKAFDTEQETNPYYWNELAKDFAPEYGSRLANLYELLLWYAYRIAEGMWTFKEVCDGRKISNRSGRKKLGGFFDRVAYSVKVVKSPKGGFTTVGREYWYEEHENFLPASYVIDHSAYVLSPGLVGVVVLKK